MRWTRPLVVIAAVCALGALAPDAGAQGSIEGLEAKPAPNDNGKHVQVSWATETPEGMVTVIVRSKAPAPTIMLVEVPAALKVGNALALPGAPDAGWVVAYWGDAEQAITDEVEPDTAYRYAAMYATPTARPDGTTSFVLRAAHEPIAAVKPVAALFNTDNTFYLAIIVLTGVAFTLYLGYAKKNAKDIFIRRIPGVDAIEDAIGRSTEMGRPILYVTGIEEIQDIQTIASILILGHVAEMTAEYDTEIKVANTYPMTMVVAEEVVRQGFANAGRLDAHRPENVMFITSEQFAFAAAVNGMILRDKPATNIYFGRFFAESLLLAETGFLTGAVQIAGTAEFTQLPFFIAACDYTLLGEELYATSAYLSREPTLLAQLKAGDVVKAVAMLMIIVGMLLALLWDYQLGPELMP